MNERLPTIINHNALNFLFALMRSDFQNRITCHEALNHPFFGDQERKLIDLTQAKKVVLESPPKSLIKSEQSVQNQVAEPIPAKNEVTDSASV